MTSNNQVSPVIRISQENRDASARATHLEAANGKFLLTTNERKQMSTKTNFKRIALVAVAALGLGVLSSVPSQAVGNVVVTLGGTATTAAGQSDSTTAATISITGTMENVADTITVSFVGNGTLGDSVTTSASYSAFQGARLVYLDTSTAARTQVGKTLGTAGGEATNNKTNGLDSVTAGNIYTVNAASIGNVGAKFGIQLDSNTTQAAGTYSFTVFVKQYTSGVSTVTTNTYSVSLVSAAPASASKTASAATSTAILSAASTAGAWQTTTLDSVVAIPATASSTAGAAVKVSLLNAASGTAPVDSLTVSIDKGNVSVGSSATGAGPAGKSLAAVLYNAATQYVHVYGDGSAGTATLTIKTLNAGTFTKTITFYGDPKTVTAGSYSSVIGSSGIGVWGKAVDALGNDLGAGTTLYAYSSDTTVISSYGTACGSYDSTTKVVSCTLTGIKSGTANITLRDAATVAASTVASNAVAVRVSLNAVATSYKVTSSATSFAPGAPGTIIVTVYDADGKVMPAGTYANLFATGGITPSLTMGSSINGTLTSTSVTTAANPVASATLPVVSTDPIMQYYYYMPVTGGTLALVTKGGASLPAAAQVSNTATVTITDNATAALAAVTALATTVASLKTLIVTLTNLVLKIQKKVKA
jgi:hypothetical protein